jgi:hypothetical protein
LELEAIKCTYIYISSLTESRTFVVLAGSMEPIHISKIIVNDTDVCNNSSQIRTHNESKPTLKQSEKSFAGGCTCNCNDDNNNFYVLTYYFEVFRRLYSVCPSIHHHRMMILMWRDFYGFTRSFVSSLK